MANLVRYAAKARRYAPGGRDKNPQPDSCAAASSCPASNVWPFGPTLTWRCHFQRGERDSIEGTVWPSSSVATLNSTTTSRVPASFGRLVICLVLAHAAARVASTTIDRLIESPRLPIAISASLFSL